MGVIYFFVCVRRYPMVNLTSPMVHIPGVLLFMLIITGRVSWGSCDPFPQLTQPTGFPCTPTGYFPYICIPNSNWAPTGSRCYTRVQMCCSVNEQPTGFSKSDMLFVNFTPDRVSVCTDRYSYLGTVTRVSNYFNGRRHLHWRHQLLP